jgi:glycosyltransferase involved in cell wall biosynthesis
MRRFFEPISVILPAKNASETIRTAVFSTLRSMHREDELIVVLDESDWRTFHKLDDVFDPRIHVYRLEGHPSLTYKLNFGIERSRNELIARMDADDICLPWRFGTQRAAFRNTSIKVLSSTYIAFGAELRPFPFLPQLPVPLHSSDISELLVGSNPIAHPTVMFRRSSVLELGGYRESVAEDLDLWLRAAVAGFEMRRIAWPTILYRFSRQSLSRQTNFSRRVSSEPEIIRLREALAIAPSSSTDSSDSFRWQNKLRKKIVLRLAAINLGLNN